MSAVFMAASINQACGGAVIAPWEVGGVPDEWLDACTVTTHEMERWQKLKREGGIDG